MWDNGASDWDTESAITPVGSDYSLGNISTPVLLKITAQVDTSAHNIGHNVQTITNSATIKWDGLTGDGIGSGDINVDIGLNPISKTAGTYDASTHEIPWSVTIIKSDIDDNLRVLDLLVYADSDFDVTATYTIDNNSGAALTQASLENIKLLTPKYSQKYIDGSFSTTDDLEITVHKLTNTSGDVVADLLVVTKDDGTGIDTSSDKSFDFKTVVTNPAIYAKNGSTNVYNTATLFSANIKINSATAKANCPSEMISKDMLTLSGADELDPSKSTTNTSKGFNYIDKSVIYRLVINENNISDVTNDITTVDGQTLGNVTVSDTLPDGWKFVEIATGEDFIIYEDSNSDGSITKDDIPISDTTAIFESTSIADTKADFVFKSLTKTYVILLKAKPLQTTIDDYFSDNKTTPAKNNVTLSAENFSALASASQKVKITSDILSKTVPSSATDGVLTWEVEYKPYDIEHEGTKIEDTLPVGIDLRINSSGELDLTGDNIKVTELSLNSNGSYSDVSDVPLILNTNIFYNNNSRKLTFIIPESEKAYRLEYKTDVTGEPGDTLTNSVKLIDGIEIDNPIFKSYAVSSADASATMQRSGWIKITKEDGSSNLLSGAEFTIYTADETTEPPATTQPDTKEPPATTQSPTTTEPDTAETTTTESTTQPPIITTESDIPKYELSDVPDPNDSNSPNKIIVIQDDGITEITYTKTQNSDGTYKYIDLDGSPLYSSPNTGNNTPIFLYIFISIVSLCTLIIIAIKNNDKDNIKD